MLLFYPPLPSSCQGGGGQFDYSVYPVLPFEILSSQRVGRPSLHLLKVVWWGGGVGWGGGGLFDYSVYSWPMFCQICLQDSSFEKFSGGWGGVGWPV